jgi:hypothetical protein
VLYRDGLPLAVVAGGEVQFFDTLPPPEEWAARNILLRGVAAAPLAPASPSEAEPADSR